MRRYVGLFALTLLICVVASQIHAQDKVERWDKKAGSVIVAGKILDENAGGVKMKLQVLGKEETIPSNEILRVTYVDLPATASLAVGKLALAEAARDFPAMLKGYEGIQALPEVKTTPVTVRRYIDYRVVSLRGFVAEGEDQVKAAAKGLADFIVAHPDSWEYPHAARQLARLQADTGDYPNATKTYEALEKAPTVPAEFKQDATAALIDIAFQSDNLPVGKDRVDKVLADAKAAPGLKERAAVYQLGLAAAEPGADLTAAVKKIEEAIGKAADPSLKALGYNVLGDVYFAKGQNRDAMWSYLWVDVVYNQDRGEHLKAMTRLIRVFDKDADKEKSQLYKEKLARSR